MKRAVITGGASPDGIGWASALALVEAGYEQVTVTGLSEQELARTPAHPSIAATILDVRDDAAVAALFAGFDRLDALVNCAGGSPQPEAQFTPQGFADNVDVNLNGAMRCSFAARDLLEQSRGAIVNIASMYAIFGSPIVPAYSASKGGIVQLTKSLAVAWGPVIRVNAVSPGWIKTGLARAVWDNDVWAPQIVARTPMARFGEPEELGSVIRFLCSDDARFVTGVTIPVDGGYSCVG